MNRLSKTDICSNRHNACPNPNLNHMSKFAQLDLMTHSTILGSIQLVLLSQDVISREHRLGQKVKKIRHNVRLRGQTAIFFARFSFLRFLLTRALLQKPGLHPIIPNWQNIPRVWEVEETISGLLPEFPDPSQWISGAEVRKLCKRNGNDRNPLSSNEKSHRYKQDAPFILDNSFDNNQQSQKL